MNTDHLKYLIAIGKTKSMSQASESLFITPQALSFAIRKLEEELGMPLLIRSSSGTELTENGQWLVNLSSHRLSSGAVSGLSRRCSRGFGSTLWYNQSAHQQHRHQ